MNVSPPVFRFAPSPNGALHLGHAYSALLNYQLAGNYDGRFLVRVEDIDQTRCTPDLENAMLDDLSWLGFEWEEPVRRQSEHFDDYAKALKVLEKKGLTYGSQLSRGDVLRIIEEHETKGKTWPRDPNGSPLFPGKEYEPDHQDGGDNMITIRLDMKAAIAAAGSELSWVDFMDGSKQFANVAQWGDVVLARRDTPTSYHLAVVVDDAYQKVTHVVRGRDLFYATAIHVLLQTLLGLPQPTYHHHELILDNDGKKLSKSRGDTALAYYRALGMTPADICKMIGL